MKPVSTKSKPIFFPSAMVPHPGLVVSLLARLFFRKVTFDEVAVKKIRDAHSTGRVVYIMNSQSLLDYMYFQWALAKNQLPLSGAANGITFVHAMVLRPFRKFLGTLLGMVLGLSLIHI